MDETLKYQVLVYINTSTLLPSGKNLLLKNYISYILIINTYIALNSQEMEYFFSWKCVPSPTRPVGVSTTCLKQKFVWRQDDKIPLDLK